MSELAWRRVGKLSGPANRLYRSTPTGWALVAEVVKEGSRWKVVAPAGVPYSGSFETMGDARSHAEMMVGR